MGNRRTSVLNEERRRSIIDFVNQNGRALVRELAKKYGSSEITIRRDLELLHNRGLVYRTHGGALPIRAGAESDRNLTEREMQHPREKQRIAAAAAKMVREGQAVVLDSGSTTTAIARASCTASSARRTANSPSPEAIASSAATQPRRTGSRSGTAGPDTSSGTRIESS